jgi:hypothetical protein
VRRCPPASHRKTTTFLVGLTIRGTIGPFVLDGPINRNPFETYVERVLAPELRQPTSLSWTICAATKDKVSGRRSRRRRKSRSRASCFWVYAYPALLRYAAHSAGGYWARISPQASEIAS